MQSKVDQRPIHCQKSQWVSDLPVGSRFCRVDESRAFTGDGSDEPELMSTSCQSSMSDSVRLGALAESEESAAVRAKALNEGELDRPVGFTPSGSGLVPVAQAINARLPLSLGTVSVPSYYLSQGIDL